MIKPIEPAGDAFMARVRRLKLNRTLAEDYDLSQALLAATGEDQDNELMEEETLELLSMKPTSWREQDHYLVLGLSAKRWKATDEDIKRNYRKKIMLHHPDKTAQKGGNDNFFKCIQKAWEVLTDPKLRRMFDSCDPTFDDSIPTGKETGDFYELYGPVFERNARFSTTQPMPELGNANTSRQDVEAFYAAWFKFDSWRTFEMMDEEDTEKASSRDEKRWLDKKNVNSRKKLKKEDAKRMNSLIETAFALDPRIKQFKADDKYKREGKKREREAAEKSAAAAAAQKELEERLAREEKEKLEREQAQSAKQAKDLGKNAVKKERKTIRRMLRDFSNFLPVDATASQASVHIEKTDYILTSNEPTYLEQIRSRLETHIVLGYESAASIIEEEHHYLTISIETSVEVEHVRKNAHAEIAKHPNWTEDESKALEKAVNEIAAGTNNRWNTIADAVNAVGNNNRTALACIHHAQKMHTKIFKNQKPLTK